MTVIVKRDPSISTEEWLRTWFWPEASIAAADQRRLDLERDAEDRRLTGEPEDLGELYAQNFVDVDTQGWDE